MKCICKRIGIIALCIIGLIIAVFAIIVGYFKISAETSKEVYRDISKYSLCRSGNDALEQFQNKGMDESIWPEKITDNMDVRDFLMIYYNPFDANYLGYLTVKYEESDFSEEVKRLEEYPSTEYIGNYGNTGFQDYDVLAMNASDNGFVYALANRKDTIIYIEMIFPGYGMDIEYNKYIPEEYLPEGLDISEDNPTRLKKIENY